VDIRPAAFMTVVRSDAMRPALEEGDVLLASRVRGVRRLRRGEILVFRVPDDPKPRIRRMIALPGDHVAFAEDGVVVLNGEPLFEPYARRTRAFRGSFTVPADRVFVLGDRRDDAHDPRRWRESFVPATEILGVARTRLFPWPVTPTRVLAR
jgi:signal peptidase I